MKKLLFVIIALLLVSLGSAGNIWVEPTFDVTDTCNVHLHVICAEKAFNNEYDPINHNISYHNQSGLDKTNRFCAILDQGAGLGCNFNFTEPSDGVNDVDGIKQFSELCEEAPDGATYSGTFGYFDENCDGDEIFVQDSNGHLDTSQYIENNVTYDVIDRIENIDYFDTLVPGIGGVIDGSVSDTFGNRIENATVTFYFKNPKGTFLPYRNYTTPMDGTFTTNNEVNLTTYFRNTSSDLIPLTEYIIIVRHPEFAEEVVDVPVGIDNISNWVTVNITLDPLITCQDDCTTIGSNLCESSCHGINGCNFSETPAGVSTAPFLDGVPSGIFVQREIDSAVYEILACEGDPVLVSGIADSGPDCPADQEVWKTTRLVKLNGKVVRMVVTLCR